MQQIRQHAGPDARTEKRLQVVDAARNSAAKTMKLLRSFGSTNQIQLTSCLMGRNEHNKALIKNW